MADDFTSVQAVVEIPKGSRNKYEYDHATGSIRLDRALSCSNWLVATTVVLVFSVMIDPFLFG